MYKNIYNNKKVLITGHTGFKGSWLTLWLLKLGAEVVGVSKDIPTEPSMFKALDLNNKIKDYCVDIRNLKELQEVVDFELPDFIFHLAAQPIVSVSYIDPIETLSSNIMGTANLLEVIRNYNKKLVSVFITSDKAYDNVEQVWGYIESDSMGGKDIYSGSKGAAELVIKSYINSFFLEKKNNLRIGIGRAGNVIGGGDWAQDRIVVDCVKSWSESMPAEIRSPNSTRPWQHVLEPLSGYLNLGMELFLSPKLNGEAFNFGPRAEQNRSVELLIKDLSKYWEFSNEKDIYRITGNIPFHEASLLKLNCDKALFYLGWQSSLNYNQTIRFTSEWYNQYYNNGTKLFEYTNSQIDDFEGIAINQKFKWTE